MLNVCFLKKHLKRFDAFLRKLSPVAGLYTWTSLVPTDSLAGVGTDVSTVVAWAIGIFVVIAGAAYLIRALGR